MSVDMVFDRNISYNWAEQRKRPASNDTPSDTGSTPVFSFGMPDDTYYPGKFAEYVESGRMSELYPQTTVGNPVFGRYATDGDGEQSWQTWREVYDSYGGMEGLLEYYTDENGVVDENAKTTLDSIKNAISEKKEINALIEKLAGKIGISSGDVKKLKIDIDSSGKILIGGIADTKKAKKLQEALNGETGFISRLKAYQENEAKLYRAQADATIHVRGTDIVNPGATGAKTIEGMEALEFMVETQGIDNIDTLGKDPLQYAYLELFRDETAMADFSFGDKGLEDPGRMIHDEVNRIEWAMERELDQINLENRLAATNNEQPPGETVSMDNVKVTLTEKGEIKIEGSFAKSAEMDSEARFRMNKILQEELLGETKNGGESNLLTAIRQLRVKHDEEFGEEEFEKIGSVTFDKLKSSTFVSAPEAELALREEMAAVVVQAVKDKTGVELGRNSLDVGKDGKITLKGLPPGADAAKVKNFIEVLNLRIQEDEGLLTEEELMNKKIEGDPYKDTVETLKDIMEELASYEKRTDRYFLRDAPPPDA